MKNSAVYNIIRAKYTCLCIHLKWFDTACSISSATTDNIRSKCLILFIMFIDNYYIIRQIARPMYIHSISTSTQTNRGFGSGQNERNKKLVTMYVKASRAGGCIITQNYLMICQMMCDICIELSTLNKAAIAKYHLESKWPSRVVLAYFIAA